MNHLNRGYEPNVQTSIQSLPFQQVQETLTVDISTPRTPVAGGQLTPVGVTPVISLPGTPRSEEWRMELEAKMRQVSNQHQVFRAEHNAQLVRIRQSTALRATPHQLTHASGGSAREISLMSEVRQFRAEEEYYRLREQLFEHQRRLQEQMIANVQQQANNHTAKVQEEARGFQRAVQDDAEVVIAQRLNHEASECQNILNGNIHQRDEKHMQLIRSRDEEYVSSMAAVTDCTTRSRSLESVSHEDYA
eukprot:385433-Amphidinium_carterae.1